MGRSSGRTLFAANSFPYHGRNCMPSSDQINNIHMYHMYVVRSHTKGLFLGCVPNSQQRRNNTAQKMFFFACICRITECRERDVNSSRPSHPPQLSMSSLSYKMNQVAVKTFIPDQLAARPSSGSAGVTRARESLARLPLGTEVIGAGRHRAGLKEARRGKK